MCRRTTKFFHLRDRIHLLQHVSYTHQVVVEDIFCVVKQPEYRCIRDRVIDIAAGFTPHHDVSHPQNRELLRHVCSSIFRISLSSLTPFSPSRRETKIRMRIGCASASKNSDLKLASCGIAYTVTREVHYLKRPCSRR